MAFSLQRPILVGGLGLTVAGWMVNTIQPHHFHFGGSLVWGTIALGSGIWVWSQQSRQQDLQLPAAPIDRSTVLRTFETIKTLIAQLETEAESLGLATAKTTLIANLRQQLTDLSPQLDRKQANLAIMGSKGVGKSTLTQLVASNFKAVASPAPATPQATADVSQPTETDASTADLVMFVTAGDITDSEFQRVQQLLGQQQRVLLVFNKQDQYLPSDRPVILQQLRDRVQGMIGADDVVAIAANPIAIKVRQHQADGSIQERTEQPEPDVAALRDRLKTVLATEGQQLVLNTVQRHALALKTATLIELNQLRRDRAIPVIEQSQWVAAGAAFANPVPTLDLLATAAINTQLVMDLAAIYQQPFSLEQAKTVAATLASQMVKLGLVEMTSQAIAPLLKSHALTYVAGGLMQGVSAAYLTRLAGLSLVEYFEQCSQTQEAGADGFSFDRLTQTLKAVFQDNQRTAFLQTLVKQGIARLVPATPQLEAAKS